MSDNFDDEQDDIDDDTFDEDDDHDEDAEEDDDPPPDIDAEDVGPYFGSSWTVPGSTESGNAVEWSTSTNAYHDQKTWEEVEPK